MINYCYNNEWKTILKYEHTQPYFKKLEYLVNNAYLNEVVYPKKEEIFKALNLTDKNNCKVVIIGQDPYHGENQANGLAFSVNCSVKTPPSLKNIFKEIELSTFKKRKRNDLTDWAEQGVLLLNSILTVRAHQPNSHSNFGWQNLTDKLILYLNKNKNPIVFLLWGRLAASKQKLIFNSKHIVLKAAHPSPLSANRGFFGCDHFNLANKFLISTKQTPIKWFD